MNFGYWTRQKNGKLKYTSLSDTIKNIEVAPVVTIAANQSKFDVVVITGRSCFGAASDRILTVVSKLVVVV